MSDNRPLLELTVLLGLVLLNGFFALAEMAIVASRKPRLKAKAGKRTSAKALLAADNPAPYLSTIQIGITLIGILSGAFGGATLAHSLETALTKLTALAAYAKAISVAIVVIGVTIVTIILGELVPKRVALAGPEAIALRIVPILDLIKKFFQPLVYFLSKSSSLILKLLGVKPVDQTITEEELRITLLEGERSGIVEGRERAMVEGVFYLGDRPVETFMTHRSELSWLEPDCSEAEARAAASADRNGVLLVAKASLDQVIGYVASSDILVALLEGRWLGLKSLMKTACFVPGSLSALKAFEAFRNGQSPVLLVLDEYGGLAGRLLIQDLMEEIVGELSVRDEQDGALVKHADGSYLIDGSTNIDDVIELFNLTDSFPSQRDFYTLAGFVLSLSGSIPTVGESFIWQGFSFEVIDMAGNRIDKVLVRPPNSVVIAE